MFTLYVQKVPTTATPVTGDWTDRGRSEAIDSVLDQYDDHIETCGAKGNLETGAGACGKARCAEFHFAVSDGVENDAFPAYHRAQKGKGRAGALPLQVQ